MEKYLNEAIQLELNVAKLYMLFYIKLKINFWYELSIEEFNHASLLKTAKTFLNNNIDVSDLVDKTITNQIIEFNKLFTDLEEDFLSDPTLEKSKEIGIFIENSAAESHYQSVMSIITDSKIMKIFQQLNKDDKDHLQKIQEL